METTTINGGGNGIATINCSFYGTSTLDDVVIATFEYHYSTPTGVTTNMRIASLDVYDANKTKILADYNTFITECTNITPHYVPSNT